MAEKQELPSWDELENLVNRKYDSDKERLKSDIDKICKLKQMTPQQLMDNLFPVKDEARKTRAKDSKPPKYRNPDKQEETWTGKGPKPPQWFTDQLASGKTKVELVNTDRDDSEAIKKELSI